MKSKRQSNLKRNILIIIAINLILFSYSVNIRKPWFGVLASSLNDPTGHHQWLTGSTIVFVKNWIQQNPFKLKFALLQNPYSIETKDSMAPYASYPPGVIIPIYFISLITSISPNPSLVMGWNLLNHFLISISLSLIIYFVLRQLNLDETQSIIASTFSPILQFLLPGTLYFHQNAFFTDQAIILPFVLFVLLEILRWDENFSKQSKTISRIQFIVNIWGLLTDWLFVFLNFTLFIKRIIHHQIIANSKKSLRKNIFYFWAPTIFISITYLLQVFAIDAIDVVKTRFILRIGLNPEYADYQNNFIGYVYGHLVTGYGKLAPHILFFSATLFILWILLNKRLKVSLNKTQRNSLSTIFSMVILAPIIQLTIFRNHSAIHDFSVLKLSPLLVLLPFAILPLVLIDTLISQIKSKNITNILVNQKSNLYSKILILVLAYSFLVHQRYQYLFPEPNYLMKSIGEFVNQNTDYSDIIFSPDITVNTNPPQMLSYTMKRVYTAKNIQDVIKIIKPINDRDYQIVVLEQVPTKDLPPDINALISLSYKSLEGKDANLYYISKNALMSAFNQQ